MIAIFIEEVYAITVDDKKHIVLIIEDEPPMLHILVDKLSESGFAVLQAKDGQEGLDLAFQKHPDLILLDVLMPHMDGMTLMTKLREDEWGKKVPVIVLTNVSPDGNDVIQSIVKNQPAYYFVKSDIKLENIVDKIHEVLSASN